MPGKNEKSDPTLFQIIQPCKGTKENPTPVNVNVGVFGVIVNNPANHIPKGSLTIDDKPPSYPSSNVDRLTDNRFLVKFQLPITVPDKIPVTVHVEDPQTRASDDAFYIQRNLPGSFDNVQIKTPISGALVNVNVNPFPVVVTDAKNSTMDGTLTINGTEYHTSSVMQLTQSAPYQWLLKFSIPITVASGTPIEMQASDSESPPNTATANYTQI